MVARALSQRTLGGALLAAAALAFALQCLVPLTAGEQPTRAFVVGAAAPPLRNPVGQLRSAVTLFAASDATMGKVADVVAEQLGVEKEKVTREATLTELGADSLDIVESVMALEEAFDIELPDEETTSLKNVGDVADLIESKL
mmetsp:Transcript_150614/g.419844  ORF Transcript_150614/g.419844 Transcript_150614/m.419844 type:complete len:143 (+) Transcript_150614:67-495(+)